MGKSSNEIAAENLAIRRRELALLREERGEHQKILASAGKRSDAWKAAHKEILKYNSAIREAEGETAALEETTKKVGEKIAIAGDKLQSMSQSIQSVASKVPIIGTALSNTIESATAKMKKKMDNWIKENDKRWIKGFKKLGLLLGGLLLGGVIAMFSGFMKLLGKAQEHMKEFSTSMTETARSLQLSKGSVAEIGKGVGDWIRYGSGWAGAISQIRDDMGYIPALTKEENSLVAKLATNAGLGAAEIANMYRHSQNMGMSLTEYTKNQEKKLKNLNKEYGVHFTQAQIIKEIAGASDETLTMFGKQNGELEKQVLIGKKIGLNLNQQASMAKSLLDIESSIEAEMEARVLTGRELNFDKARELALNGDISGASQEIMDQVGGITEFNKMNIIQKEALAKAAGMEVGAMQKSMEMQAGLPDQADPGGGGLATGNVSMDDRDAARSRRWGTLLEPLAKALDALKIAVGDKLYAWFNTGPGKTILEDIQTHLVHFVNWLSGTGPQPEWITTVKKGAKAVGDFFTDHGKNILLALGIGGAIGVAASIYEKVRGSTRLLPMYVSLVGGLGNMGKRISNWMRKGKKSGWRRNLLAKAKRATRVGGSGGGIFGKAYRGIKGAGQKAMGGIKSAGTKFKGVARSLNPLAALKKAFSGNAGRFMKKALGFGGKFAKGGLLGALLNAKFLYDIVSNPKLNPMDKAKGVIQLGSSIIGGGIGAIAGSIVGPVGTFGGGMLGSLIGDWIGSMPAIQNALAPPLSKAFKGEEVAEDFILSGRGIQRFRKDDLVIGGTRLNEALGTGDNKALDEVASLLKTLIEVTREDRVMSVDGKELANALAETANYRGVA
jgi:hypothetical protein